MFRKAPQNSTWLLALATPILLLALLMLNVLVILLANPGQTGGVVMLFVYLAGIIGLLVAQTLVLLPLRTAVVKEAEGR